MAKKLKSDGGERVAVGELRAILAPGDDIRDSVGFQNDINGLLAQLEELRPPWKAAAPLFAPKEKLPQEKTERQPQRRPRRAPVKRAEETGPVPLVVNR